MSDGLSNDDDDDVNINAFTFVKLTSEELYCH
jgi:hypothetical protein